MSSTITYKGSTLTTVNNQTRTLLTSGKWLEDNITITDVTSGGSVTVTGEANATGTTCVITSGSTPTPDPTPTPSGNIPLNTQLIDYTTCQYDKAIGSDGSVITQEWYYVSDFTAIDPSMTFSYKCGTWTYIGVYDSSQNFVHTITVYEDGTVDPGNGNVSTGTLSGSKITGGAYVRLSATETTSDEMSLIRTA